MSDNIKLKAYEFAMNKHKGQKDDDGKDYFYAHVCQVAHLICAVTYGFPNADEIVSACYLHDTIEDTETTYEELKKEFGQKIADLVNEVTHNGQKDEYGYYFPRLKSKEAIMIKFSDRLSNLSRMSSWDEKRQDQYLRKSKFWNSNKAKDIGFDFLNDPKEDIYNEGDGKPI